MAKSYGILGLTFGQVFASITSPSKKRGYEEMIEIAQMLMLPESDIVVYQHNNSKKTVDIYYKDSNGRILDITSKKNNLVQTIISLADKNGESSIVAIA